MSENAILFLKRVWFSVKGRHVVGVSIDCVRAAQVTDLGDAQLPVAHLFV